MNKRSFLLFVIIFNTSAELGYNLGSPLGISYQKLFGLTKTLNTHTHRLQQGSVSAEGSVCLSIPHSSYLLKHPTLALDHVPVSLVMVGLSLKQTLFFGCYLPLNTFPLACVKRQRDRISWNPVILLRQKEAKARVKSCQIEGQLRVDS